MAGTKRRGLGCSARETRPLVRGSTLAMLVGIFAVHGTRAASLDVYGRLPTLEDVALSPDGSRIAFVRTQGDARVLVIASLADRKMIGGLRLGSNKLRSIEWADDEHLMTVTSATAMPWGLIGGEREWFMMQVYDLPNKRLQLVPDPERLPGIRLMNVISGHVMVRRLADHTVLYVPGLYVAAKGGPALIRFDLQNGSERLVRQGPPTTYGWVVDDAGEISAEQDYDDQAQRWTVKIRRAGRLQEITSGVEAIDFPRVLGYGPTADTLLMQGVENGDPVWRLLSLKDGSLGPPLAERATLDAPIEDRQTHRFIGGVHIDDDSHYVFFDANAQGRWNAIVDAYSGARVRLASVSADFAKFVVRVEGPTRGFFYDLVDMNTARVERLGDVYDGIKGPLEVRRITYEAADGLRIPAYLTLPHTGPQKNLPLIVLAHGGPATRDTADFDWWSQALAEEGYAVLRPNYRGSNLSRKFIVAGFGQWGRKMQTDLSDGVRYLARAGIADPARVCIVGASYGGYAALAGATLDPGVYRCAVSVAGLSDLRRLLEWVNSKHLTASSWEQRYWDRFMGITGPSDPALDALSPIKHLNDLNVPILLIHGRDDTVVPFEQSEIMFDALRRANKSVELVAMKHEDHWLSRSETRLQMLQSTVAFLRAHNPPNESGADPQ